MYQLVYQPPAGQSLWNVTCFLHTLTLHNLVSNLSAVRSELSTMLSDPAISEYLNTEKHFKLKCCRVVYLCIASFPRWILCKSYLLFHAVSAVNTISLLLPWTMDLCGSSCQKTLFWHTLRLVIHNSPTNQSSFLLLMSRYYYLLMSCYNT